jgi:hypothetical protein
MIENKNKIVSPPQEQRGSRKNEGKRQFTPQKIALSAVELLAMTAFRELTELLSENY